MGTIHTVFPMDGVGAILPTVDIGVDITTAIGMVITMVIGMVIAMDIRTPITQVTITTNMTEIIISIMVIEIM